MPRSYTLVNAHMEGGPFFWEAGQTGVLLVHGATATSVEVRLLAKILHEKGYTVAGPLLPGHGTTPQDANRHTWQEWVQSTEDCYQQLKTHCSRFVVCGESVGALLAIYLACQHSEIECILTYSPALKLAISSSLTFLLRLISPFVTGIRKGTISNVTKWQGYPINPLKMGVQVVDLQKVVIDLLPRVTQPILIVGAGKDATVDPVSLKIIYDNVNSKVKELHWMENAAHTVLLDPELDKVVAITLDFMERVLSTGV